MWDSYEGVSRRVMAWLSGIVFGLGTVLTAITGVVSIPSLVDTNGVGSVLSFFLPPLGALAGGAAVAIHAVTAPGIRWQRIVERAIRLNDPDQKVLASGSRREDRLASIVKATAELLHGWDSGLDRTSPEARSRLAFLRSQANATRGSSDVRTSALAIMLSMLLLLASLTAIWAFAERGAASFKTGSTEPQAPAGIDRSPVPVMVTFLIEPDIASSPAGCKPAATDYAFLVGGSYVKPALLFLKQGGPVPTSPNEPIPQRSGACHEASWMWTAEESQQVLIREVS